MIVTTIAYFNTFFLNVLYISMDDLDTPINRDIRNKAKSALWRQRIHDTNVRLVRTTNVLSTEIAGAPPPAPLYHRVGGILMNAIKSNYKQNKPIDKVNKILEVFNVDAIRNQVGAAQQNIYAEYNKDVDYVISEADAALRVANTAIQNHLAAAGHNSLSEQLETIEAEFAPNTASTILASANDAFASAKNIKKYFDYATNISATNTIERPGYIGENETNLQNKYINIFDNPVIPPIEKLNIIKIITTCVNAAILLGASPENAASITAAITIMKISELYLGAAPHPIYGNRLLFRGSTPLAPLVGNDLDIKSNIQKSTIYHTIDNIKTSPQMGAIGAVLTTVSAATLSPGIILERGDTKIVATGQQLSGLINTALPFYKSGEKMIIQIISENLNDQLFVAIAAVNYIVESVVDFTNDDGVKTALNNAPSAICLIQCPQLKPVLKPRLMILSIM
jgi:hypothetical protein